MRTAFCWNSLWLLKINRAYICLVWIQNNRGYMRRRNVYKRGVVSIEPKTTSQNKLNFEILSSLPRSMREQFRHRPKSLRESTISRIPVWAKEDSRVRHQVMSTCKRCTTSAMFTSSHPHRRLPRRQGSFNKRRRTQRTSYNIRLIHNLWLANTTTTSWAETSRPNSWTRIMLIQYRRQLLPNSKWSHSIKHLKTYRPGRSF